MLFRSHQAGRKIQSLVSEAGDERWVYVRFRTREEDEWANQDDDEDEDEDEDEQESPLCLIDAQEPASRASDQP